MLMFVLILVQVLSSDKSCVIAVIAVATAKNGGSIKNNLPPITFDTLVTGMIAVTAVLNGGRQRESKFTNQPPPTHSF